MNVKELLDALDEIKRITKRVPAEDWTHEFHEIANIVHRTLRDQARVLDENNASLKTKPE
jgi:hypothetical protein